MMQALAEAKPDEQALECALKTTLTVTKPD
jgi:hypothetical protein